MEFIKKNVNNKDIYLNISKWKRNNNIDIQKIFDIKIGFESQI